MKFDEKKPKKKKRDAAEEATEAPKKEPAVDNDKRYKILLERIKEELHKNNPALAEKVKIQVSPPDIERLHKKIIIKNFGVIAKQLDRPIPHVMNFFLSELGSEGSQAGDQLTIKNRLQQKNVESLFKKYITEYVQCQLCKSQKTILEKDKQTRLEILQCENCKSQRSVAPIGKKG